jgi:hypothetical protein
MVRKATNRGKPLTLAPSFLALWHAQDAYDLHQHGRSQRRRTYSQSVSVDCDVTAFRNVLNPIAVDIYDVGFHRLLTLLEC